MGERTGCGGSAGYDILISCVVVCLL